MVTSFERAESVGKRDGSSDWTQKEGAELVVPQRQLLKRTDAAPGLPNVMVCAAMADEKPENIKADDRANMAKDVDRKAAPDNIFDRVHQTLKNLPALALQVKPEAGELYVLDLGKFIQSADRSVTNGQADVLNSIRAVKVKGDQMNIAWEHQGDLKSLLPDSKDIPDGLQLSIKNPQLKVSADQKAGQISLTNIQGIIAFHPKFPLVQMNALDKVIATKKVDKDGNASCELKLVLPKLPGVPEEMTKSIPLTKESAQVFDAAVEQISSGKDTSKIIELLPALFAGESAKAMVALLSKMDRAVCANDRVQIALKEKQRIGQLPLIAGTDVAFESKSVDGGYVFDKIYGVHLELPVPAELLAKLGAGPDAHIKTVAVSAAGANGERNVRIDFGHGTLKSLTFAVDKEGAPRIADDKLIVNAQVGVNDKSFDCQLKLPVGKGDNGIAVSLAGDGTARTEILKKLGVPDELTSIGGKVTDVTLNGQRLDIALDGPTTLSIKGLDLSFDRNISLTVHKLDNKFAEAKGAHIDITGIQVSGFNFAGEQWKKVGSQALNRVLNAQNDLPMKLDGLSLITTNDKLWIGVSSNQGMLKSASFVVRTGDNSEFISGSIQVKHPLRNLDPVNLLLNREPLLNVNLDQNGVVNPVDTGFELLKPITDSPFSGLLPPVRAYKTAKFVWNAVDDPVGETKRVVRETAQDLRDAGDAVGDAARFTGRNLRKAWNFIVD